MKETVAAGGRFIASRRRFLRNGAAVSVACTCSQHYALASDANPPPLVSTPSGKLRGELSDGVRIFRGVPFAQPPTGPLRFRPTVSVTPWQGTRDATVFAPAALQPLTGEIRRTSEDCLYLNIWAPSAKGPHPVFVWIHGGGFTGGSPSASLFDGSQFAREGILCVTVAYRLGVFGFMDLEPLLGASYADSGNNAMRDLVTALEWIHANIAAFGGDPTKVTVGGESAGAKATAALMAIPRAAALFGSAISESGGGERVLTAAQAAEVAHQFGDLWHENNTSSASFNDLKTAPGPDLLVTQKRLIDTSTRHFPFRSETGGELLPQRPVDLVAAHSSKGKRLLIGTNRDESAAFLGPHPEADPIRSDLGNLDLSRFDAVFAKYQTLYPEMAEAQRRIRAVTAEEYWVPSIRLAAAQVGGGGQTWMYRLDYSLSDGRMAGEAQHGIDLGLIWQKLDRAEEKDPAAIALSQQMHQAWLAFLQGEPPSAAGLPVWPTYDTADRSTMIFSAASHVARDPFEAELQLWNGVL